MKKGKTGKAVQRYSELLQVLFLNQVRSTTLALVSAAHSSSPVRPNLLALQSRQPSQCSALDSETAAERATRSSESASGGRTADACGGERVAGWSCEGRGEFCVPRACLVADAAFFCRRLAACTPSSAICRPRRSIGTTPLPVAARMLRKSTFVVCPKRGTRTDASPATQDGLEPRLQRMLSTLGSGGGTLARRVERLNTELVLRN